MNFLYYVHLCFILLQMCTYACLWHFTYIVCVSYAQISHPISYSRTFIVVVRNSKYTNYFPAAITQFYVHTINIADISSPHYFSENERTDGPLSFFLLVFNSPIVVYAYRLQMGSENAKAESE